MMQNKLLCFSPAKDPQVSIFVGKAMLPPLVWVQANI